MATPRLFRGARHEPGAGAVLRMETAQGAGAVRIFSL